MSRTKQHLSLICSRGELHFFFIANQCYGLEFRTSHGNRPREKGKDIGIGKSTLSGWITQYKYDDLMAGPHDDMQKELERLRKENKMLR